MRIFMFLPLALAILTASAGVASFRWLRAVWNGANPILYEVVYALLTAGIIAVFIVSRMSGVRVPDFLTRLGHYALGVLIYWLIVVNVIAAVYLIGRLIGVIPASFWVGAAALMLCVASVGGLSVYGIVHAGHIKTARYVIELPDEKADRVDEMKIALISDLHLGKLIGAEHLAKVTAVINDIEPDMVLIAGDVFDGDVNAVSEPETVKAIFREINAPLGVYACLGNHDAGRDHERMPEFLESAGVRVLLDEYVTIADRVMLIGRRDSSPIGAHGNGRAEKVGIPKDNELPVIVMDHQPGNIGQYGDEVDLIVSGHTHKGQLFPGNIITDMVYDVDYGYYRKDESSPQVVVTSGAGTWGPIMRVGSDCEVAEIIIK